MLAGDRDLGDSERLDVVSDVWVGDEPRIRFLPRENLPTVLRAFRDSVSAADLVYCNGFFDPVFSSLLRLLARASSTPTLIAPRGEFSKAALAIKPTKKRIFLRLARLTRLDRNAIWHASTEREAADIQRVMGGDAVIVVRENDSLLPSLADRATEVGDVPRLVFVSRLLPNKGLHIVLEALATVAEPWTLDVYGTEEDAEYVAQCRSLAAQPALVDRVRFRGVLAPDAVRPTFGTYDLFAFPTSTENFGHVIAEALSVGCPVAVADTTPWTERIAAGGGIRVEGLAVDAWRSALTSYLAQDRDARLLARERAADAFDAWRNVEAQPHVFDLVRPLVEGAD